MQFSSVPTMKPPSRAIWLYIVEKMSNDLLMAHTVPKTTFSQVLEYL